MWTNNGKKLFCKLLQGNSSTGEGTKINLTTTTNTNVNTNSLVNSSGGVFSQITYYNNSKSITETSTSLRGYWTLYIGTGTTPPTVDDYTLEAPIEATLLVAPTMFIGGEGVSGTLNFVLQNDTGSEQIITELGLVGRFDSSATPCLFNRRLLENPVTMQNGEAYNFTFAWNTSNLAE